jgi:hypothetical protein
MKDEECRDCHKKEILVKEFNTWKLKTLYTWKKSSGSGLENRLTTVGDPPR